MDRMAARWYQRSSFLFRLSYEATQPGRKSPQALVGLERATDNGMLLNSGPVLHSCAYSWRVDSAQAASLAKKRSILLGWLTYGPLAVLGEEIRVNCWAGCKESLAAQD
jgi:hypothetical protein